MAFLKSVCLALTTFSRLPAPRVEWCGRNMRHLLCAFPIVGVFVGVPCAAVLLLARSGRIPLGADELALALTAIPLLVTGGIHMDGFLDTADALSSRAPLSRKLEILKDPRVGSGAVVAAAMYFLASFVVSRRLVAEACSAGREFVPLAASVAAVPVLSRLLSALAASAFPCASTGTLRLFADGSRRFTSAWSASWFAAVSALLAALCGRPGVVASSSALAAFAFYYFVSVREFGGTTGDLAGWFVQVAELSALAACAYLGGGPWFW